MTVKTISRRSRMTALLSLAFLPVLSVAAVSCIVYFALENPERNAFLYTLWRGVGLWYVLCAYIAVVVAAVWIPYVVITMMRSRTIEITSSDPSQDVILFFIGKLQQKVGSGRDYASELSILEALMGGRRIAVDEIDWERSPVEIYRALEPDREPSP